MTAHSRRLTLAPVALLCGVILGGPQTASGQDTAEGEIVAVVQEFFDAMAAGDSALGASTLLLEGQFTSIRETPEGARTGITRHSDFLTSIASGDQARLERMWDPTVLVQGRVAMLWTPYDFHIDGEFSHCGIDVFSLLKTDDRWRIAGVSYTVERDDCPESPLGPPGESH